VSTVTNSSRQSLRTVCSKKVTSRYPMPSSLNQRSRR
jgi:hypothetical protein